MRSETCVWLTGLVFEEGEVWAATVRRNNTTVDVMDERPRIGLAGSQKSATSKWKRVRGPLANLPRP